VTALPTIAAMIGANRIVRGTAITSPFGDPQRSPASELALRRRIVERALELLETEVEPGTVAEDIG
jgi:glycine reductase